MPSAMLKKFRQRFMSPIEKHNVRFAEKHFQSPAPILKNVSVDPLKQLRYFKTDMHDRINEWVTKELALYKFLYKSYVAWLSRLSVVIDYFDDKGMLCATRKQIKSIIANEDKLKKMARFLARKRLAALNNALMHQMVTSRKSTWTNDEKEQAFGCIDKLDSDKLEDPAHAHTGANDDAAYKSYHALGHHIDKVITIMKDPYFLVSFIPKNKGEAIGMNETTNRTNLIPRNLDLDIKGRTDTDNRNQGLDTISTDYRWLKGGRRDYNNGNNSDITSSRISRNSRSSSSRGLDGLMFSYDKSVTNTTGGGRHSINGTNVHEIRPNHSHPKQRVSAGEWTNDNKYGENVRVRRLNSSASFKSISSKFSNNQ